MDMEISQEDVVRRVTWTGLWANLGLSAVKFAGGIWGGSQAVIADAVHSLSDITTDLAILFGVRYWSEGPDEKHPHGHYKVEMAVTLFIGIVLAIIGTGLLWHAINTMNDQSRIPSQVALWAAVASIVVKEGLYRWTAAHGKRIKSMPLIANAWHHRSDALSSLPVAAAVIAANINPNLVFLDKVGAVLVAIFIYKASYDILMQVSGKFLDASAPPEVVESIQQRAMAVEGVCEVHQVRTRYLGSHSIAVDMHVLVDSEMSVFDGHEIATKVKYELIAEFDEVEDVVVHLEPYLKTPRSQ